jgi:hypothetical protein
VTAGSAAGHLLRRGRREALRAGKAPAVFAVAGAVVAVAVGVALWMTRPPAPPPATAPASAPAASAPPVTKPASRPATAPAPPQSLIDVIKKSYPAFPATQPLEEASEFADAARLILDDPIYLCLRGQLWITRADADPADVMLTRWRDETVHVCRERVAYVHWYFDEKPRRWTPAMVVRGDDESLTLHRPNLPKLELANVSPKADWSRAVSFDTNVVVPNDAGVDVIAFASIATRQASAGVIAGALKFGADQHTAPVVLRDGDGLIAWAPHERGVAGSGNVIRFDGKQWQPMPDEQFGDGVVQITPLLDGTARLIRKLPDGAHRVEAPLIRARPVDEAAVTALVRQLSSRLGKERDEAEQKLTQFGPAAWPILEKLRDAQPPEGQDRIDSLLAERLAASIGGMSPVDGQLAVASRLIDGGVVLIAEKGVTRRVAGEAETLPGPTWLALRPGNPPLVLQNALVDQVDPKIQHLAAWGEEWVLFTPTLPAKRFVGNHYQQILSAKYADFDTLVGIDASRRWIFRDAKGRSLLIDPTLPDTTPRLPTWLIESPQATIARTKDGRAVTVSGDAWALGASDWAVVEQDQVEPIAYDPAPATRPTSGPSVALAGETITVEVDGSPKAFALPPELLPVEQPAHVTSTQDGRIWAVVKAGAIDRLRVDGDRLVVEGSFTRNVPADALPAAVWVDPQGRLILAYPPGRLLVAFPTGRVPRAMANMMPARDDEEERDTK